MSRHQADDHEGAGSGLSTLIERRHALKLLAGAGVPLQAYCGTYTSNAAADSGFFNVTIRETSLTGFALSKNDSGDIVRLNGDVTGTGTVRDVTIEDPDTFIKPVERHVTWQLTPGEEIMEAVCAENNRFNENAGIK